MNILDALSSLTERVRHLEAMEPVQPRYGDVLMVTGTSPTLTARDWVVLVDDNGAAVNIALPDPPLEGYGYYIKYVGTLGGSLTVTPDGAAQIDGAANYVFVAQYESIQVVADGTDWYIVAHNA